MNCRDCQYFYVTWEVSAPYGCKAHGFKSSQLPSMVVFSSSGEHCLLFRRKA
ncbi:MAG: uracil-DNA glycosylase [Candidatus Riflebacteria bacterium]|nr:uracil-DNA glycosylase [Candidatus Riflebacteria bacterium]